jgi:hypothetical protein
LRARHVEINEYDLHAALYILLRESRHVREFGTSEKASERYTDPNITSVKS